MGGRRFRTAPYDAPRAYRLDILTSKRYPADMSTPKRATLYIDGGMTLYPEFASGG